MVMSREYWKMLTILIAETRSQTLGTDEVVQLLRAAPLL